MASVIDHLRTLTLRQIMDVLIDQTALEDYWYNHYTYYHYSKFG